MLASLDFILWAAQAFSLRSSVINCFSFEERKSRDDMYDGLDRETSWRAMSIAPVM